VPQLAVPPALTAPVAQATAPPQFSLPDAVAAGISSRPVVQSVAAGLSALPAAAVPQLAVPPALTAPVAQAAAPPQFSLPDAVAAGISSRPVVQSVAAIRPAPSPVAGAPASASNRETGADRAGTLSGGPANITFGDINIQGGANASAEEIGEEFGRQITARLRSQFADEF